MQQTKVVSLYSSTGHFSDFEIQQLLDQHPEYYLQDVIVNKTKEVTKGDYYSPVLHIGLEVGSMPQSRVSTTTGAALNPENKETTYEYQIIFILSKSA